MKNKVFYAQVETTTNYAIKAPNEVVAKELVVQAQLGRSHYIEEFSLATDTGLTDNSVLSIADEVLVLQGVNIDD